VAASGDRHEAYRRALLHTDNPSISREVIRTGAPVVVPDMAASPFASPLMQQLFPLGSCLGVALTARGKTLGALLVGHRSRRRVWTSDEVNRLQTAANQVALSIDNVQLYEEVRNLAIHDPLTGVYNRRYLEQRLLEEVTRSVRYDRPLSCIMVDLDHFKRINDQYGHATGDRVLQEFARRIGPVARRNDVLARYGGEEFTLLLPECSTADALRTAERIRGVVARRPFRVRTEGNSVLIVPITASLGVCSRTPAMQRPDQLLSGADTALYAAKHQGRNRVACHHFDSTGPLYEVLKS
jgi:diguanylate cyclase (GGDEF)-like protein